MWDWAEVQVGGSYREYALNSSGTIYTDYDGPISYGDMGLYTQIVKKMADDRLVVTGAARYDKAEFSDGAITPRVAIGYTVGKDRNHNIRLSVQTGYRNPTTQDLFIGFDVGRARLIGSAPDNPARYQRDYSVSAAGQALGVPATVTLSGENAFNNSFSLNSVLTMAATGNPGVLEASGVEYVKPEQMQSIEFGWRAKLSPTFTIDANIALSASSDIFYKCAKSISKEVHQLSLQAISISNKRLGNRYIFGGYKTQTKPFDENGKYHGDDGKVKLEVNKDFFLPINMNGKEVFFHSNKSNIKSLNVIPTPQQSPELIDQPIERPSNRIVTHNPKALFSQKIFTTEYQPQADIKVFVVDYESKADLKVFKVDYQSQSKGNEGLWYFVQYRSISDKKIHFVDYPSQSDLKIYFVKYKSQSGWRNNSKKYLLY